MCLSYVILCRQSTEHDFEVWHISSTGYKYHANLLRKECDCRKWLLIGLPCCHAISCMRKRSLNIYDFVPDCYRKAKYKACYSSVIFPANGQCLWERTEYNDLQPPPIRRQPGRPKKKRNKEVGELLKDEGQLRRGRWGVKCTRCKQPGHNKATCKLPPAAQPAQTATRPAQAAQPMSAHAAQHTQTAQPMPAQAATRTTQSGLSAQRTTQGAQAVTEGANKRKRNQKEKLSSSQPEGSKGKKKKATARVDGSVSTQH